MNIFKVFKLQEHGTTVQREFVSGMVGFLTVIYIIAVNSSILSEAGIPIEGAVIATVLTSFAGCLLMGLWANAPILLVPGMGINALFTYTLVHSMKLSWQDALAVVFISGIILSIIAFTKLSEAINKAIPHSLKDAITVGLGFFLLLIGLEKGGLVVKGSASLMTLGDLSDPKMLATILTLLITIGLFIKNVPGNFLWSILLGTGIGALMGVLPKGSSPNFSFHSYTSVFSGLRFGKMTEVPFWMAVFSVTMVIVFENIGLVHGHTALLKQPEKFRRSLQANSLSACLSGLFGSSPTVSTVETTAAIAAGGRTGLTACFTGCLFLVSLIFIPYIQYIPDNAIAPILILIGGLMIQNMAKMDLSDLTEALPAIIIIGMIPFTFSIADGMAMGFILYPILKAFTGRLKEVSALLYLIALLFLLYFLL
ncbi:NCS2 family permease [Heyndrickxia acidicola]|uniref:NCS2 family permease n=1 Tax=Heyndrickxia acidicola TaxID=209389 RepID=A0ABU6MN41_9BACI|nr:NCS2 family permease [Heyndrickxia acidicola]MED1205401.1 NCS2 family permease [Heyndrickxia acidicola]